VIGMVVILLTNHIGEEARCLNLNYAGRRLRMQKS